MTGLHEYIVPYVIANIYSFLCVVFSVRFPMLCRVMLAILFAGAAVVNADTAIRNPDQYLFYGQHAMLKLYQDFIYDFFAADIPSFILMIAFCQLLIFVGLLLTNGWVKVACWGGAIFGIAIAPLGLGSAFPATVIMSIAFVMLANRAKHDYVWNCNQYKLSSTISKKPKHEAE